METATQKVTCDELASTTLPGKSPGVHAETVSIAAIRVGLAHLIHEINNRLQLIHTTFCNMEMDMACGNGGGDFPLDDTFNARKTAVEELMSLVSSLRAQLESLWEINPSFEAVDLSSLVETVLESELARFESRDIFLAKDIVAGLPLIQGNKTLLEVALRNLLKNASEAMPEGGNLRVATRARDSSVCCEIADSGVGIPPGLDIFQPFATSKSAGMGLGLAIVHHIVQIHGGTVDYRSEPGRGTTFCMTFPLKLDA